ncbi:hypothetical protein B0H11DRAFT_2252817 [Mycena galericulata]|nr:hypothetical protein B0H11DRAFT_2252817 [Mycena galericulata]
MPRSLLRFLVILGSCLSRSVLYQASQEHPGKEKIVQNDRVLGLLAVTRALSDRQLKVQSRFLADRILSYFYPSPILPVAFQDWDRHGHLTPPYLLSSPFPSGGMTSYLVTFWYLPPTASVIRWIAGVPPADRWDIIMSLANGEDERLGHERIRPEHAANTADFSSKMCCSKHMNELVTAVPALLAVTSNPFNLPVPATLAPLPQLSRDDYPLVKYWYRTDYAHGSDGVSNNGAPAPRRGGALSSQGINVSDRYIETEDGEIVNGYRVTAMGKTAGQIWFGFVAKGISPPTWGQASLEVVTMYNNEMCRSTDCDNQLLLLVWKQWPRQETKKSKAKFSAAPPDTEVRKKIKLDHSDLHVINPLWEPTSFSDVPAPAHATPDITDVSVGVGSGSKHLNYNYVGWCRRPRPGPCDTRRHYSHRDIKEVVAPDAEREHIDPAAAASGDVAAVAGGAAVGSGGIEFVAWQAATSVWVLGPSRKLRSSFGLWGH